MSQRILLVAPPFTQLNTPYPATAYLKGFFDSIGVESYQTDLSILTILKLFSSEELTRIFDAVNPQNLSANSRRIYALRKEYLRTVDSVIEFLQGKRQTLAQLIAEEEYLPRASHFNQEADLEWAFGAMGFRDKARHLCTLYLEDLCDFIVETTDANFGFSRYAEQLGRYAGSFDELEQTMSRSYSKIDQLMLELFEEQIQRYNPTLIVISIPFPGNLLSALRCGQWVKKHHPHIIVEMGGGFVNTELRSLSDVRVFDYTDYITLDDGEAPLQRLVTYLEGRSDEKKLMRTYIRRDNQVVFLNDPQGKDIAFADTGTPTYEGLPLDKYLSVIEIANPMHKLWSDGRWNKLTFAHGCYWGKCAFCDGSLDYIGRYEPASAVVVVDRMERLLKETGEPGFHFVDEAAPPVLMREVAIEILRRGLKVIWWTNVRFEKSYTTDLCRLLKASGCIAVSGGLEVASDRLLKLINKGVTVEQVARVASNFTEAGIMVHAYLMYGFPTQTVQETIDSLEVVRQMFCEGIIQSGFWHRFAMTAHSPVGKNPEHYHAVACKSGFEGFADNDRDFEDPEGADHELFGDGLRKSLFNYMHGVGLDFPLYKWFGFSIPSTTVSPQRIRQALKLHLSFESQLSRRLLWIGGEPIYSIRTSHHKGKRSNKMIITIHNRTEEIELVMPESLGNCVIEMLSKAKPDSHESYTLNDFKDDISSSLSESFIQFLEGEDMQDLFQTGLLMI